MNPKICECGKRGKCKQTRQNGNYVRRNYFCVCGKRWTTYEARKEDTEKE